MTIDPQNNFNELHKGTEVAWRSGKRIKHGVILNILPATASAYLTYDIQGSPSRVLIIKVDGGKTIMKLESDIERL